MCVSEIAVITGSDGRTVPLSEPGMVVVYRRVKGTWLVERSLPFSLEADGGLAGLRSRTGELIAFLRECRTFVALSASGALFFGLEKAGCQVWEITGTPDEFLDTVWRDVKEEQEAHAPVPAGAGIPAPLETSPGKFTISIRDIQRKRPEVSSKQVLQQFIRRGGFTELVIACDHLPPWIEVEAERLGILVETEYHAPHEMLVILRKAEEGACC